MDDGLILSEAEKAHAATKQKINELENVARLTQDTIELIASASHPGKYCSVILNVLNYHEGFLKQIQMQIETLKATLPAVEPAKESAPAV